ncbi:MAG: hypothetical protein QFE16_02655 [Pseudomonadota bacterium]|nr:hypothetical protein [Pseudomonadota bacterium]
MDAQEHGTVPGLAAPELAHHDHVDLASLGTAATHAVVTPTSKKAPDAANVGGPVQTETQCLIFEEPADDGKRFATLRAHLALKGYSLLRTAASDGPVCFYVTRWGMARELRDLAAVARFLDQVGGAYA